MSGNPARAQEHLTNSVSALCSSVRTWLGLQQGKPEPRASAGAPEEGDPWQELTGINPIPVAKVSAEVLQQYQSSEGAAVCSGAFPVPKPPQLPPCQEQQHLPSSLPWKWLKVTAPPQPSAGGGSRGKEAVSVLMETPLGRIKATGLKLHISLEIVQCGWGGMVRAESELGRVQTWLGRSGEAEEEKLYCPKQSDVKFLSEGSCESAGLSHGISLLSEMGTASLSLGRERAQNGREQVFIGHKKCYV